MGAASTRFHLAFPLAYLLAGVAWVLGSDAMLAHEAGFDLAAQVAGSLKGIAFVVVSTLLLFAVQAWPATTVDDTPVKSRRDRVRALVVFAICATGVAAGGATLYRQQATEVRGRASANLADATGMTARQLERWILDRRRGLDLAGSNAMFASGIQSMLDGRVTGPGAVDTLSAALGLVRQNEGFERLQVFTPDGRPLAASGGSIELTEPLRAWMRGATVTGRVVMSDLYVPIDAIEGRTALDFVVTINGASGAPVAVLVARADPRTFLLPMLRPTGADALAPTYSLARRDGRQVVVLSRNATLRGAEPVVEHLRLASQAGAAQALAGRAGVFEARDERGEPMLVAGRAVAGTPWYLVTTVELAAVHASLQRIGWLALVFTVALASTAALLVTIWWRADRGALARRVDAAEHRATRLQEHFVIAGRLVHDLVVLIDARDATILEVNDRAVEAFGRPREELLGSNVFRLRVHDDDADMSPEERLQQIVEHGAGTFTTRYQRSDGSILPLDVSARTLEIDGHLYVQAIGRDISERLEHERRLAALAADRDRALARLELQFERMAAACIVLSVDGTMLQVNPAFERMFETEAASVVNHHVLDFVRLPRFREEVVARLEALRLDPDSGYCGVHENITSRGRAILCRWNAAAMRATDGTVHGYVVMAEDITEVVRTDRALRDSEARYRALSDISPVGIFRTDLAGQILFANPRVRAITGVDLGVMDSLARGRAVHPGDLPAVRVAWHAYVVNAGRTPYSMEFRLVRPDGAEAWVLTQVMPEHADDGRIVGHIGTVTDITAVKRAQLELQQAHDLLEDRVRQRTQELVAARDAAQHSDRVKSAFLSTVSHELRTPLNSILGFTDVLLNELAGPLSEEQSRQLQMVRAASTKLRSLVEDILDVSRIEAGQVGLEYGEVDLHELVAGHVGSFEDLAARKGITLRIESPGPGPTIRSDARRLGQIVGHLVSNAVKFTDAGEVTIAVRTTAQRVEISVTDTGVGIPEAALAQIFNPFMQVSRPGGRLREGTGLGLAISRNLARALGGDVTVHSEPGCGSRFTLWLPAVVAVAA
jgi:PAS domain S-box-containing protein